MRKSERENEILCNRNGKVSLRYQTRGKTGWSRLAIDDEKENRVSSGKVAEDVEDRLDRWGVRGWRGREFECRFDEPIHDITDTTGFSLEQRNIEN